MPPYRREILASSFMASKSGAAFGNKYDNTIAAAAEKVEWPEGYAGKFGSPITVVMPGSSCSRVRGSPVCLTSDNSCRIWADEVDGGAGGRSVVTSADVMSHACSRPKFGSIGGRGGDSWLIQGISPRATALSASACHWAALPTAFLMPSAPARAMSVAATALPNASPAAISLAAALPDHSAALRCSAARWVISATAAGK